MGDSTTPFRLDGKVAVVTGAARGKRVFGIFKRFPNEGGRNSHLSWPWCRAADGAIEHVARQAGGDQQARHHRREAGLMAVELAHHRLEANGLKQHYVEAGSGPPVILLHGFPETWYAWRHQIPVLGQHYRLIVPDLRGYGATEKPAAGYD